MDLPFHVFFLTVFSLSRDGGTSLVEQWQDELGEKFNLEFDILSREMIETSRSGNPFNDRNLLIARLDVLARNEDLQEKLRRSTEWDVVISDEAHRMSASFFGGEVKYTKRYQLGQKLGQVCRHLLLMGPFCPAQQNNIPWSFASNWLTCIYSDWK